MRIRFSKNASKFLKKVHEKKAEKIRVMLKTLLLATEQGITPFKELRIRKLEGKWLGYYRMRTNGIRIIYKLDRENREILVHDIEHRGSAY